MRTGLLVAALLMTTAVSHWVLEDVRDQANVRARQSLSGILSTGEIIGANMLGGFRSIAINILWVRILLAQQEEHYGEIQLLFSALEVLQARSPMLHYVESDMMSFDIARKLSYRPEERWQWIRGGLAALSRGRQRFPGNQALLWQELYHYYFRFHPTRSPADRGRFLAAARRDGEAVEYGRDPLDIAREAGHEGLQTPGHHFRFDAGLWAVYKTCDTLLAGGTGDDGGWLGSAGWGRRDLLDRATEILRHAQSVHEDLPGAERVFSDWQTQLEERRIQIHGN